MEFDKVGSVLAELDFAKIAISDGLKYKAKVERGGRQFNSYDLSNKVMDKLRAEGKNPSAYDTLKFTNHEVGIKGPEPKYNFKNPVNENQLMSDMVDRAFELNPRLKPNIPKPTPTQYHSFQSIGKTLGKGALIAGGIGAAGYGAKKLYDHYKTASNLVNALEVGGLGILAKPGVDTLRNPNASAEEKNHAKYESAGLGVLAAHPAYELGKEYLPKAKAGIGNFINKMRPMASSVR